MELHEAAKRVEAAGWSFADYGRSMAAWRQASPKLSIQTQGGIGSLGRTAAALVVAVEAAEAALQRDV